jgi:hypothetical protein
LAKSSISTAGFCIELHFDTRMNLRLHIASRVLRAAVELRLHETTTGRMSTHWPHVIASNLHVGALTISDITVRITESPREA